MRTKRTGGRGRRLVLPPVSCLKQLEWTTPLEGDVQVEVAGKHLGFGDGNKRIVADLGDKQRLRTDQVDQR